MANDKKQAQNDKSKANDKSKKRSRVKETFAELKKVTWPTFGKTMKQTGAVFVVTIFFLLILLVMDQLLGLAHQQLAEGLKAPEEMITAVWYGLKGVVNSFTAGMRSLPILL